MTTLTIATRRSPLAMWQAEHVQQALERAHPDLNVDILAMSTQGDRVLDVALAKIGGKGLFVKELETALYDGRADLAVHSIKDVPMQLPEGLVLSTIMAREDPHDALVSSRYRQLDELPQGACVGTSSLRRQCQLRERRPDLVVRDLRGNVNTRLARLDAGDFDAIILACAGLQRLRMHERIARALPPEEMLPAVGQGAIGIEIRADDERTRELLAPLHDTLTAQRVLCERAMNRTLEGSCTVPIAGHAILEDDGGLWMRGLVGSVDGTRVLRVEGRSPATDGEALGERLARDLLAQGAGELLAALRDEA